MAGQNIVEVELSPKESQIEIAATHNGEKAKKCNFIINATEEKPNSKEIIPGGTITKQSKVVQVIADETITHKIKNSKSKTQMNEKEILLQVGQSTISVSDDGIVLSSGGCTIKLSAEGITVNGASIEFQIDGAIKMAAGDISGSAGSISFQ
tara:strand:- start:332 stop:787 length:456 start_codon:yes stop_codon:yes gene_type:complete